MPQSAGEPPTAYSGHKLPEIIRIYALGASRGNRCQARQCFIETPAETPSQLHWRMHGPNSDTQVGCGVC